MGIYVLQLGTPDSVRLRYDLIIANDGVHAGKLGMEEHAGNLYDVLPFDEQAYVLSDVRVALLRMVAGLCCALAARIPDDVQGDWEMGYLNACDLGRAMSRHIGDPEYQGRVMKAASDYVERVASKHGITVL